VSAGSSFVALALIDVVPRDRHALLIPYCIQVMSASSSSAFSLDAIVHQIKTTSNPGTVSGILRNIPRDVRDIVLIGPLAGDQDPLHVLDVRVHTLGVLYIL
jgi:hypothetical protein